MMKRNPMRPGKSLPANLPEPLAIFIHGVVKDMAATTVNKQKVVSVLFSKGKKLAGGEPQSLSVTEQVIYSICREGATPEQADKAYKALTNNFFDWNEVRVSAIRELEECFDGMTRRVDRALRITQFLQELFETTYSFEMEFLHKKGVKQASKHLSRYQAANDYLGAWVTQRSLGGHAIPVDPPTLRVCKRTGLVDEDQKEVLEIRNSLEHLVPKSKGTEFTDVISMIGVEYCHESQPQCKSCPLSSECRFTQSAPKAASKKAAKPKSK